MLQGDKGSEIEKLGGGEEVGGGGEVFGRHPAPRQGVCAFEQMYIQ